MHLFAVAHTHNHDKCRYYVTLYHKSDVYLDTFFFCSATWCEASPLASVRHGRLIDSSRLAVDPPSQRLLLSPPLLRSPSPSPSSIAAPRSPTRHRQQGCSEGAAQPENGTTTTTRPVDLSIPSAPLPAAPHTRAVAEPSLTELPGE